MDADLRKFVDWLTPSGKTYLELLLYAMRRHDAAPFTTPDLSLWPGGTDISNYSLTDEAWPLTVELFEIRTPMFPEDYENIFSLPMIDLIRQDATLSWYMFDATFGEIPRLFTQWQAERTYGIFIPGDAPRIAVREACRQSKHWAALLRKATQYIHECYPQLKSLYGLSR